MTGKKAFRLIVTLILLAILGMAAYFILLTPSGNNAESAKKLFQDHQSDFKTTAEYLLDKNIDTDILGFRTIDENYGIHGDDSKQFKDFAKALSDLQNGEIAIVRSHGGSVTFETYTDGGLLVRDYIALTYAPDESQTAAGQALSEKRWFWSVRKSDQREENK